MPISSLSYSPIQNRRIARVTNSFLYRLINLSIHVKCLRFEEQQAKWIYEELLNKHESSVYFDLCDLPKSLFVACYNFRQ